MPQIVQFSAPHVVELVSCDQQALTAGTVRVRTWYSGISAVIEQYGGLRSSSDRAPTSTDGDWTPLVDCLPPHHRLPRPQNP